MSCEVCHHEINGPFVGINGKGADAQRGVCGDCLLGADDVDALLSGLGARDFGWTMPAGIGVVFSD